MKTRADVYQDWTDDAETSLHVDGATHVFPRPAHVGTRPGTGGWLGASGRIDVTRELFRTPAGWSLRARAGTGWIGHHHARLCLLQAPDGDRLLFVHLDALAGFRWVTEALGRALAPQGVDVGRIFTTCTHAHVAPGDLFGDCFYDSFADSPRSGFDAIGADWLVGRIAAEASRLASALQPVTLASGAARLPYGAIWQRALGGYLAPRGEPATMGPAALASFTDRGHPPGWEPVGGGTPAERAAMRAVDPEVPLLVVRAADGSLCFALGAVHATPGVVPAHAELYGFEASGAASCALEAEQPGAVVALAAGCHGDANLSFPGWPVVDVLAARAKKHRSLLTRRRVALRFTAEVGRALADALRPALAAAVPLSATDLDVRFADAFVPGARVERDPADEPVGMAAAPPGPRTLGTDWGFGRQVTVGSEFSKDDPPDDLHALGSRLPLDWSQPRLPDFVLSQVTHLPWHRPASKVYPPFAPIRCLRVGGLVLVGLPAEPTLALGDRVRGLFPGDRVMVLGNVGAFMGYADTVGGYQMREYEGASTYWGRDLGPWLVQQVAKLAATAAWVRSVGAPAADAWLCGGRLRGGRGVGGSAWFSLTRHRASRVVEDGPGRPLHPARSGFLPSSTLASSDPLPPASAPVAVRGFWRPRRAAARREAPDRVSWPRIGEHGPVVVVELAGGGVLRSDTFPMLVVWDGDHWHFEAELPSAPLRFRVEGAPEVGPHGPQEVPFTT